MKVHGMDGLSGNTWRIDGKRKTNATKIEQKIQSENDKRKLVIKRKQQE